MAACGRQEQDPTQSTAPQNTTVPKESGSPSTPTGSDPVTTDPVTTDPVIPTDPKPTDPKPTDPKPTQPIETKPTQPVETKPTQPAETKPTQPVETKPTQPVETKPTQPVETKPTQPVETKPTQPVETKPTRPVETRPTQPVETRPTDPEPSEVPGTHKALAESEYYQYSTLASDAEKRLYRDIVAAIQELRNEVDVSAYSLDMDTVKAVADKAVADHPQYFYVSKAMFGLSQGDRLTTWVMLYSDGTSVDTVDSANNILPRADRTVIRSHVTEFEAKIAQLDASIPAVSDQVAMEKAAYDYVIKNIAYDFTSAGTSFDFNQDAPTCFDAYGALIKGSAVCEGYAKLFQYLCYRMGINAIQVIGTGGGGSHMWNMAKINGNWYHLDPTWGDGNSAMVNYAYFNLTQAQICQDHAIGAGQILPAATASEAHYSNTVCLRFEGENADIGNVANAVKYLSDTRLFLYTGGVTLSNTYLSNTFGDPNSRFRQTLRSYGYGLADGSMGTIGSLYYINIKKI